MNRNHETPGNRLDERIAGCERRIGEANENAREHEREAKAYDEAGGIIAGWSRQASGIWQDLHQHVRGEAEWRRLEQDYEARTAMSTQAQNACLETHDGLARQAKQQHENELDIRDEQNNLQRAKREYENDGKQRRDAWD